MIRNMLLIDTIKTKFVQPLDIKSHSNIYLVERMYYDLES